MADSKTYIDREKQLRQSLTNAYQLHISDVQKKILQMRDFGKTVPMTKKKAAHLLLSIMCACGCRKTEILDPSIAFQPYQNCQTVDRTKIKFGTTIPHPLIQKTMEYTVDVNNNNFNIDFVIVQTGVCKDKIAKDQSHSNLQDRWIVKPTIALTSLEIVELIMLLRENDDFTNRREEGAKWNIPHLREAVCKNFPEASQHASSLSTSLSSNFMRKVYANASFFLFNHVTYPRRLEKASWIAMVLGHDNRCLRTSLFYSNIEIVNNLDSKQHEQAVSKDGLEITRLKEKVTELEMSIRKQSSVEFMNPQLGFVSLVAHDKSIVTVPKRVQKRKYKDLKDLNGEIMKGVNMLIEHNVHVTNETLGKLGFGRTSVMKFRKNHAEVFTHNQTTTQETVVNEQLSNINTVVYVLELQNGNYYVGKTEDLAERMKRHHSGRGSEWTKLHKPIKIIEARVETNNNLEKILTLQYMRKFGWNKVRGYTWCQRNLLNPPAEL